MPAPLDAVAAATGTRTTSHITPMPPRPSLLPPQPAHTRLDSSLAAFMATWASPVTPPPWVISVPPGPSPRPASPGTRPPASPLLAYLLPTALGSHHASSTDSALVAAIATIQVALAASQERGHAASRALEQERAMSAALTAQMATAQHLILGHRSVVPKTPLAPRLDADHIAARHAQAAGLHNIGPSCPSCWTRRPPTTLVGGVRSSSLFGAMLSPTTSSTTSSPRRHHPGT